MKITYQNLNELDEVAKKIINFASDTRIWTFEGVMGAGKTTLIQAIGKVWEVEDTIQSPTYSLVNEYHTKSGQIIYHFDFYRIQHETEAMDIGYEDYFYSDAYCLIEWPSRIANLIPHKHLRIGILIKDDYRIIELNKYE